MSTDPPSTSARPSGATAGNGVQATPTIGRVLLVGQPTRDRAATHGTLRRAGFDVRTATEADVLADPAWAAPGLLLLDDDTLTRDERADALRRLRSHPSLQGIPVLVLGADRDIEAYSSAITKGAAGYLLKPVTADALIDAAGRLCGWTDGAGRTLIRRQNRRAVLMKVEIDIRARKVRVPGQLVDVSPQGCRVELGEELPRGGRVRIILHGPQGSTHVALGACTRWHRVRGDGVHTAGLRFSENTAAHVGQLFGLGAPAAQLDDTVRELG